MKKLFNKLADKLDESLEGAFEGRNAMLGRQLRVGQHAVRVEALLGEGGFASIYTVRDVISRAVFALKHVRMAGDADAVADVRNEVAVMQQLKGHPNVLALQAVAYVGPEVRVRSLGGRGAARLAAWRSVGVCPASAPPGYLYLAPGRRLRAVLARTRATIPIHP